MSKRQIVWHGLKLSWWLFAASLLVVSLFGAYLGTRGGTQPYRAYPTQPYEEVSFPSEAEDALMLGGWFFPADSQQVVVIVHGWAGNRARLLGLAEYLQRQNLNVLTFDVRGDTGRNTYGQRESQDLAGAMAWITQTKGFTPEQTTILGNSIGGAATIVYTADHPVSKLVLLSPVVDIGATKWTILKDKTYILPRLYALGATLVEQVFLGVKPTNPKEVLGDITAPTLVLHGTADEISPVQSVYDVEQQLVQQGRTNFQFRYVDNARHAFLDDDAANGFPYSQLIAEFITQP